MARLQNTFTRLAILTCSLTLLALPLAQATDTYYFTGAIHVESSSSNYSPAVQAQCPHDHPVACHTIQQPNYCCPSQNTCSYVSDHTVACCPSGQQCSGWSSGAGAYQPNTQQDYHDPTPTYHQPPPENDQGGGGWVAGGTDANPQNDGQYCQTIVAQGPGLPRTDQGACGTILIVEEAEEGQAARLSAEWAKMAGLVVAMQALGGAFLVWR